jgi:two-component system, cell cycle response regulator
VAPADRDRPKGRRVVGADPAERGQIAVVEYEALQARYRALLEQVARNESLLRKTKQLELQLLRAGDLAELLGIIVVGLREAYALDVVTLNLADPQHELRHIASGAGYDPPVMRQVRFIDSIAHYAPQLEAGETPWLGAYRGAVHRALVPDLHSGSVALIPLPRDKRSLGVLAFGSRDAQRFQRNLASDFLAHLGVIVSVSLETAVNRARLLTSGVTDFLTGLHNRRYLQDRLREELARAERSGNELACLMIDVDHFKEINDRHGHLGGDAVLKEIGRRIATVIRGGDTGARFGGDEFAILVSGAGLAEIERLGQRLSRAVSTVPVPVATGIEVRPTLSIGAAAARPKPGKRDFAVLADQLLAAADAALYRAKRAGRDRLERAADVLT